MASDLENALALAGRGVIDPFYPLKPDPHLEAWKAENPLLGFASETAGFLVPYSGWTKLAKAPEIAARIGKVKKGISSPVGQKAFDYAATTAPVDALRLATHTALGGEGQGTDALALGAISTVGAGALGAGHGVLKAAGKAKPELSKIIGEVQKGETPQEWLKTLRVEAEKAPNLQLQGQLNNAANKVARQIRTETPVARFKNRTIRGQYISKELFSTNTEKPAELRKRLNRLFRSGQVLDGTSNWGEVAQRAGLTGDWEALVKYPRLIRRGKKKVNEKLLSQLRKVDDNVFASKEGDGLYVVAKRVPGKLSEKTGKVIDEDKWLLFKTADIRPFAKVTDEFAQVITEKNAWVSRVGRDPKHPTPTLTALREFMGDQRILTAMEDEKAFLELVGAKPQYQAVKKGLDFLEDKILPTHHQLRGTPLARVILSGLIVAADNAQTRATQILNGKIGFVRDRNLLSQATTGTGKQPEAGSITDAWEKLTDEGLEQFNKIKHAETPQEELDALFALGEVDPTAYELATKVRKAFGGLSDEVLALNDIAGTADFTPLKDWLLPRVPAGKFIRRVLDKEGKVVTLLARDSVEELDHLTDAFLDKAGKAGKYWGLEKTYIKDTQIDRDLFTHGLTHRSADSEVGESIFQDLLKSYVPKTFSKRENVPGFKKDFTKKELKELIEGSVHARLKYIAGISWQQEMLPYLARLNSLGDSKALRIIENNYERFQDIRKKGPVEQAIDRTLSPFFGKDSAMKTISTANRLILHTTFGFGDLGYSAMTALTGVQTVLPEVYAVARSPAYRAKYYDSVFTVGKDGMAAPGMAVLSGFKLMRENLRLLGNPTEDFWKAADYAMIDGTLIPRFAEAYAGQTSSEVLKMKTLFHNKEYGRAIEALSEISIAAPERFSRMQSFSMGYLLGRDIFKLTDKRLYRFAKQFTDKTMYRYGSIDRPGLFQGPVGSSLGLFKTWVVNYMANLMGYVGVAARGESMAPLLATFAGNFGMVGLRGAPLYGVADGMSRLFTDQHLMEHVYKTFNGEDSTTVSDAVYLGLPTLLGVSLTSRASPPANEIMRDVSSLTSIALLRRMKAFGDVAHAGWNHYLSTGDLNVLKDPKVTGTLLQATTPKIIYRGLSSLAGDSVIDLRSGYPKQQLDLHQRTAHWLGLTPTEMEKKVQVGNDLYTDLSKRKRKVSAYGEEWAELHQKGDTRGVQILLKRAVAEGLDLDSISASARKRNDRFGEDSYWRYSEEDVLKRMASLQGVR